MRPVFRPAGFKRLRDNESLQLGYVRFINTMQAREEMIFAISLPADARAATVFNAVEKFYDEKDIPMQNLLQCATDGAATMAGKHQEFVALTKKKIPDSLQPTALSTGSIWSPVISVLNCITHYIL